VTSRRVVIRPLRYRAEVPAQVPGKDVAALSLDELRPFQDATRSDLDNRLDWSMPGGFRVKLRLPETGVSLGELSRLPKGSDWGTTCISRADSCDGDYGPGGIALTVAACGAAGHYRKEPSAGRPQARETHDEGRPSRSTSYSDNRKI